MKTLIAAVLGMIVWGANEILASYHYENTIGSYWALSDKASTLVQKSTYLDQYVEALERSSLAGTSNAIFLKTPNNSFDQNMVALKSLQGRMHQIQNMDEQSFAYQTAIQQITAQEQGEAYQLTSTFEGCWYLANHPFLWQWIDAIVWITLIGTAATGAILLMVKYA
jgi:hypothetical protein